MKVWVGRMINVFRKLTSCLYRKEVHECEPKYYKENGYEMKEYMVYERKVFFVLWYTDIEYLVTDRRKL